MRKEYFDFIENGAMFLGCTGVLLFGLFFLGYGGSLFLYAFEVFFGIIIIPQYMLEICAIFGIKCFIISFPILVIGFILIYYLENFIHLDETELTKIKKTE